MVKQKSVGQFKFSRTLLFLFVLSLPLPLHASFIESTIGTAVVNDATATYYNPAALTLLKNPQLITLGSIAYFRTEFTGQAIQSATGFMQSGTANSRTHYFLPSFYVGLPTKNNISFGVAVLSNFFNRDSEENSILRYVESNNSIQDLDVVPAIGIKLNDYFSVGAGFNISHAKFLLRPISGIPSLNIPDSQSRNDSSSSTWGADVGLLLKLSKSTLIGFNYRSLMVYDLSGKSVLETNPAVISNHYQFKFWTPARSVISINHFVTQSFGLIATIQYIQWSVFRDIHIQGIATRIGIINATVHQHLHNSWLFTLGSNYRVNSKWTIRMAGTFNQSPGNPNYQIVSGDSFILGGSMSYALNKTILIDGSYAHAFIKNQNIHIMGRNIINGVNKGSRDSVSLKLTINV